jgi:Mn-dependent DtxR family transcriptional regulator
MAGRKEEPMKIQESGEMYLESILVLSGKKERVRSIDVCEYMGFSKPSVSRAIGLLRGGGYVNMAEDGSLTLTELGKSVATKMYDRHRLLTDFLVSLGVDKDTAATDACKIEHHISDESFEALKRYICK